VEVVGYANPALVMLDGREQGSGRACTLLVHQSSIHIDTGFGLDRIDALLL